MQLNLTPKTVWNKPDKVTRTNSKGRVTSVTYLTAKQRTRKIRDKTKKVTVSSLKKKAWVLFSKYIRLRDCLETTGTTTQGRCCTCGVLKDFKEGQAGHFQQGRHNATLFDKRNCHFQCYVCNCMLHSNPRKYQAFMEKKYGLEVIKELDELDQQSKQWKPHELEELITQLKIDIEQLSVPF